MAILFNGTTQYIQSSYTPPSLPITMSCWFYVDPTIGAACNAWGIGASGSADGYVIQLRSSASPFAIRAISIAGAVNRNAQSTTTVNTGEWHHATAVFVSSTERYVYLDGSGKGSDTNSSSPAAQNQFRAAATPWQTAGTFLKGALADIALWSVQLTDDEVTSLGKGFSPLLIRPSALEIYGPLVDLNTKAVNKAGDPTIGYVNSPTTQGGPPLFGIGRR